MNHLLLVSLVTLASLPSLLALPQTCAGCPEQTEVTNHSAAAGHVTASSPLIGCRWTRRSWTS